jgi:putative ABC transport system permease protein
MDHIRFAPALLVSGGTEADAANAVRIVAQFDPAIRVRTIKLAEQLSIQLQPFRYGAAVAATLGLSALALATIGTFGVFMYSVRQRTREIGIRVALGAKPTAVIGLILAGQTHALLWGLGAGIAGAAAASAVLRASLFGITPLDPVTYGGVVMALVVAGIAASYVPARRATSIDPATALRYE